MPALGFLMSPEGKVFPFGKWVEKVDREDRIQLHNTSFEDEVSHLDEFQALNLPYNPSKWIMLQAFNFTDYGVVMFFNTTYSLDDGLQSKMFIPKHLTQQQRYSFGQLYPELSVFDTSYIYEGQVKKFFSIDDFYQENNIPFGSGDKNQGKLFSKTLFSK